MPTRILKGGRVLTMAGPTFDPGYILIENGKISAIGALADLPQPAPDAGGGGSERQMDRARPDRRAHPCRHRRAGLWPRRHGHERDDRPVTPQVRAIDATNPDDEAFRDALAAGITAVNVMPGSANVIGGLAFAVKTYGSRIDQMVLRNPTGMKAAMGENPKRTLRRPEAHALHAPGHRRPVAATCASARRTTSPSRRPKRSRASRSSATLRLEQMALVLRHEIPMRIHAHRADDILTALRIRDEFGFDMVLDHSTEAFKLPDELTRAQYPRRGRPHADLALQGGATRTQPRRRPASW